MRRGEGRQGAFPHFLAMEERFELVVTKWPLQEKVLHARDQLCFVSRLFYVLAYIYKGVLCCTAVLKHMPLSPGAVLYIPLSVVQHRAVIPCHVLFLL